MTHICVHKLSIIGSDNGLSPARRPAIIWTNAGILLTLNVRGPSYLGLTRSISWLLVPRLLASPGHQQPWYWLCRIGRSLSYPRRYFNYLCRLDSLWPSDALWRKRSGSTLAHVMACCLTTPSHYLNQCWLIISKVQWHLLIIGFIKISLGTMR